MLVQKEKKKKKKEKQFHSSILKTTKYRHLENDGKKLMSRVNFRKSVPFQQAFPRNRSLERLSACTRAELN